MIKKTDDFNFAIKEQIITQNPSGIVRTGFNRLLYYFEYNIINIFENFFKFEIKTTEDANLHSVNERMLKEIYNSKKNFPKEIQEVYKQYKTLKKLRIEADYKYVNSSDSKSDFSKRNNELTIEHNLALMTLQDFEKYINQSMDDKTKTDLLDELQKLVKSNPNNYKFL